MFRIILISFISIFFAQASFAVDQKAPQTLEEINAELLAKKAALEPFNPKDVKVDLESLGLDDVEKKPSEKLPEVVVEKKVEEPKAEIKEVKKEEKPAAQPVVAEPEKQKPAEPAQGMFSKIQNIIQNVGKDKNAPEIVLPPTPTTTASDIKKPSEKYLNLQKKKSLKKRLEAEKQKKWNEKQNEEKLKKLAELRKKYLEEPKEEKFEGDEQDEDFVASNKIIPQKKDLNPFRSEEMPAAPILNRYRTKDDLHIPLILTIKERIALLFSTVSIGSVSAFNEAYKDIQNPNVQNETGDTILTYAIILKKYPIIASVLAKGADPNMPNKLGYTPTNIAIELLDFKSFELLAQNKADLEYIDAFGRTYLMHASRVGLLPAVDLLVSHRGLDVNAMDHDGFTSLAIAYRHKKEIIVSYLLKHGAKTWIEKPYDTQQQSLINELENRWQNNPKQ